MRLIKIFAAMAVFFTSHAFACLVDIEKIYFSKVDESSSKYLHANFNIDLVDTPIHTLKFIYEYAFQVDFLDSHSNEVKPFKWTSYGTVITKSNYLADINVPIVVTEREIADSGASFLKITPTFSNIQIFDETGCPDPQGSVFNCKLLGTNNFYQPSFIIDVKDIPFKVPEPNLLILLGIGLSLLATVKKINAKKKP